jgi:hypothetical protein
MNSEDSFSRKAGRKRKSEPIGIKWRCSLGLWLHRVPERLRGSRDERREATRKRLRLRLDYRDSSYLSLKAVRLLPVVVIAGPIILD